MASLVSRDTSGVLQAQDGEREDLRTRSAKRFLVQTFPDGRKQYRVGATIGPVHYKTDPFDATEDWKEIDLTIRPAGKGKGWQYEVTDNGYQVRIWQRYMMPWHYTAEFRRAGEWVRMAPVELRYTNAAGKQQTIAKPAKGLTPVIDNDAYTVTWQDCFGKGLHFRYNISPDAFCKTVVIDAPAALPATTIGSEGLRVEIVMALSWSGQAGNGFGKGRDLSVLRGPEDAEEERSHRYGKHPHLMQDGLAALWMAEPRAWDAEGETLPMDWGLERKGRRVYGAFGVKVADLAGAAWPVAIDTAITEEQIAATENDVYGSGINYPYGADNPTSYNYVSIGKGGNIYYSGFWLYTTVPIPAAATIDSAAMTLTAQAADTVATAALTVAAEAADNPVAVNSTTHKPSAVCSALTTATAPWSARTWSAANVAYNTPSLATVVKELVDREGWVSGNSILFAITAANTSTADRRRPYDWGYSNAKGAKFNCTYTEGTPTPTGNPIWYYNMLRRAN